MIVGAKARIRRIAVTLLVIIAIFLGLTILIIPPPDLSAENVILRKIAKLSVEVDQVKNMNVQRHGELQRLFQQFASITNNFLQAQNKTSKFNNGGLSGRPKTPDDIIKELGLSYEGEALLKQVNWTYDLSLPSIFDSLPHAVKDPKSLQPAFKWSKGKSQVPMVMGIPTVKRQSQSYLEPTLRSIFEHINEEEAKDVLIILMIAEPNDFDYVKATAETIGKSFAKQIDQGLLEIISPPAKFYPDFSELKLTFGDDIERVHWRSKQNLDYAFLMMYAKQRGSGYYVQLEDDILTKPNFVTTMKDVAAEYSAAKQNWFVIDFCQLGFIGKLFRTMDLPILIQFFLIFFNDKPVDWLLYDIINTKVCSPDQDKKKCKAEKNAMQVQYKPSLFQHIGTHSSLKGKVQKLKDKQFGKISLFRSHRNPSAMIETNIKHYKHYSISRAYRGESFYWGLVPEANDFITFTLTPPVLLSGLKFVSGNVEHPSDRFVGTTVEVLFENSRTASDAVLKDIDYKKLDDDYMIVAEFDSNGVAENTDLTQKLGKVYSVRIKIHGTSSENWVILSEIHLIRKV